MRISAGLAVAAALVWLAGVGCGPEEPCTFSGEIERRAGPGATNCGRRTSEGDDVDYECVIRHFRNGESWFRVWEQPSGPTEAKVGDGDDVVLIEGRNLGGRRATVDVLDCKNPHVGRVDADPSPTEERYVESVACDLFGKEERVCEKGDRKGGE